MCESYARSLLRVSVAQICQASGWDAVQVTTCDLLTDVLHLYIQQLARRCHRYSEFYGRTDPVLDDFSLLGVSLSELEDYVHNLEPVGFAHQTRLFPVSKNNVLQLPQPGARNAEERKDYIPDYMPPLVSLQEEEGGEALAGMGTSADAMQVPLDEDESEKDEAVNDENHTLKRHLDIPEAALGTMPTCKRPRMHPGTSTQWGVEPFAFFSGSESSPENWTMDDSINEMIRNGNQGSPSATPQINDYMLSGSSSPPAPEPLLKAFEEKNKTVPTLHFKKKLKKELKTKLKKEKAIPKDKGKGKLKEKSTDKNRDKSKEFSKESKIPRKEYGGKHSCQRDVAGSEGSKKIKSEGSKKIKSRGRDGPRKEKDKRKDKRNKEKGKNDKDKSNMGKDRSGIPSIPPPLPPIRQDRDMKSKEDKKKDKKKRKDSEKEKKHKQGGNEQENAKEERERKKEEKRKEKDRQKEKEKQKEKERIRLQKAKLGAGQDKIVISKVVPNTKPKTTVPKTPASKSGPGKRSWTPPPCPRCNKPDDGSPMIGCDDCDYWYHWPCVGIHTAPNEDQQWLCVKCTSKKDRKHKKMKHKMH